MSKISIILGCCFGDEGKGMKVDSLAATSKYENSILNIRFSGGQQCGHHVMRDDGVSHIFSNFGSATFRGIQTYWMEHCTFDPIGFTNEHKLLQTKMDKVPTLLLNSNCPITTPYDKLKNISNYKNVQHGTVGVGFGATKQREEDYYSLRVNDMFYPEVLKIKLNNIKEYYQDIINKYNRCFVEKEMKIFYESINYVLEYVHIINNFPKNYNHLIFEGSQGLLLDQTIGFFPNVTRGNTGIQNIINYLLKYEHNEHNEYIDIHYVTRGYLTRHGNGPFNKTEQPNFEENYVELTNLNEGMQGEFKTTILNTELLNYAIQAHERIFRKYTFKIKIFSHLLITCMDHLKAPYKLKDKNIMEFNTFPMFFDKIKNSININFATIGYSKDNGSNLYLYKGDKFIIDYYKHIFKS